MLFTELNYLFSSNSYERLKIVVLIDTIPEVVFTSTNKSTGIIKPICNVGELMLQCLLVYGVSILFATRSEAKRRLEMKVTQL